MFAHEVGRIPAAYAESRKRRGRFPSELERSPTERAEEAHVSTYSRCSFYVLPGVTSQWIRG